MQIDPSSGPAIKVDLGGAAQTFLVDSGNDGSVSLRSADFDCLRKLSNQPVIMKQLMTAKGISNVGELRLPSLDLAGLKFQNLICVENKGRMGILGIDFLERNVATLDFPAQKFYLKAENEFDRKSEDNMAGLRVMRTGADLITRSIDAGSPAERAGFVIGDKIVALNGKPAAALTVPDLNELFRSGEGQPISPTFSRGNENHTVNFALHRRL